MISTRPLAIALVATAFAGCSSNPVKVLPTVAVTQPSGLAFQVSQLAGSWAESVSPKAVCTNDEVRYQFDFSLDGKRLTVRLNKIHPTEIGDRDEIPATIVVATERTLTISYDGETRLRDDGKPMQWQLVNVSPGVYRWREASWPALGVNPVVGIRCPSAA